MKLLIKNGRIIDPASKRDAQGDILVENGVIVKVAKEITDAAAKVIDARGKVVMPGLVDMHVHLREPGREDKETVASATLAAVKGGVTTLLAMPNTYPPIDSAENIKLLEKIIKKDAHTDVLIAACISKARQGKELVDLSRINSGKMVAITDDGSSVDDDQLMLEALGQAKKNGFLVICHSEDKKLSGDGVVNLGITSTRMGVKGVSRESEYMRVRRDIQLAKQAQSSAHIAHISCRESVQAVAEAKKQGIQISADTAPHYFSLTDEETIGYDTNMKVNPPLRSRADLEAIKKGLQDGTIDAIASDHAPHTENEKDIEFDRAEFGMIGLETELALGITELVGNGVLDWVGLAEKMAYNPARILGIKKGTLQEGSCADIVVISPDKEWVVSKDGFLSKSKNSPFLNRKLKGVVECTIRQGKVVYTNKQAK